MVVRPDLIILNGKAITFDPEQPRAQAVAISGNKIVAVGGSSDMRALATEDTRIIDAMGATILPGFIDSHVHLFAGAAELGYLDLAGVYGIEKLRDLVSAYSIQYPDDEILFGVGASYQVIGPDRHPTRQDLDLVSPDRPFAMISTDHHTVWANTSALELAGILHGAAVDQGAEIVMAADGRATGELREASAFAAILLRTRFGGRELAGMTTGADPVPTPTLEQRARDKEALAQGLLHCARHGITGLHNMDGNFYTLELLDELRSEGRLVCRVEVPFHFKNTDGLERFAEAEEMRRRWNDDMLWCRRVKMFLDGVIKSRTALMVRPYPGTTHHGDAVFGVEEFNEACIRADALGFQIAVHAIGDLAVRRVLDGFEAARSANGSRDSRHRIEHIETLHPDDLPRFAELDVIASLQPGHAPFGGFFDKEGLNSLLYPEQKPFAFAGQQLRDSGAKVIFSTDWPVMPVDAMGNIRAAVVPVEMPAPWEPQSQSLEESLYSYTAGNAYAQFAEDRLGRLRPGMLADVVLMDMDIEALEPEALGQATARMTICGGAVTWEA
ncbi:amidohydrolase [Rhizobium sp. KVB221]|uniref:Amidohydrolase n=1 Tax=Rhizobium setariae TaxID=2801340 RepID=A0A936YSU0_9HYPH|nr:amidohydrolase [Rhizobium setariae]MBL0372286.1 amidohydrolase [Rhizobium setariae]